MFTGIIKEVGRIKEIVRGSSLIRLEVSGEIVYQEAQVSDSVSLNGVCLTLIKKEKGLLFFEVITSSLAVSNLKRLRRNDYVNLEPALKLKDKLGGHFVLGHIDGEARLRKIVMHKDHRQLEVEFPSSFRKFILENGSVALEGISLTVKKVLPRHFSVDIIPFTYGNTNLKYKRTGDWLNIEFDYLLKRTVNGK